MARLFSGVDLFVILVRHAIGVEKRDDIVHRAEHDAIPFFRRFVIKWQHFLVENFVDAEQIVAVAIFMTTAILTVLLAKQWP